MRGFPESCITWVAASYSARCAVAVIGSRSLAAGGRRALLDQSNVAQLNRRLELRCRLRRRRSGGLSFGGLVPGFEGAGGAKVSKRLSPLLLCVTPLELTYQAGMAGPAQTGENLAVDQRRKELIALRGSVLRPTFGIDGVHFNGHPQLQEYAGPLDTAGPGHKVDIYFASLALAGGGFWLFGLALPAVSPFRPGATSPHRPGRPRAQLRVPDGR